MKELYKRITAMNPPLNGEEKRPVDSVEGIVKNVEVFEEDFFDRGRAKIICFGIEGKPGIYEFQAMDSFKTSNGNKVKVYVPGNLEPDRFNDADVVAGIQVLGSSRIGRAVRRDNKFVFR